MAKSTFPTSRSDQPSLPKLDKDMSFFNRMRYLFNIGIEKSDLNDRQVPVPGKKTSKNRIENIKLPSDIQKLWDWWMNEASDTADTLKNRFDRYRDLDYMYYNNTVISMAIEMYADETVQADDQEQVIQVYAKDKKVEDYIRDFFTKIGINQKVLRSTAFDLALYGEHFWIHPSNKDEGITQIVPIDVYTVHDRFEFNAIDAQNKMNMTGMVYTNLLARDARIQALTDYLQGKNNTDIGNYFEKYLFGFQIEKDIFLPPWNVTHFRRFSTKSEFYPFGRPLLINAISPFRQLQASKNLVAMARVAKFPKEKFEVQVDENMTEVEKWAAVNESREEYENLGVQQTGKEEFGVGARIWLPQDAINYELVENNLNVDDISDLEMLRDDIILATRIPKGYLIVDRSSFGTSGQSLLQQFKPFGRSIYSNQTAILDELAQLVRLQFAMTGEFDYDTPFEITMSFPVIEESQDRLRQKGDTFRLAMDIITNLSDVMGINREEGLPPDVIKSILSRLSFLDTEDINAWVNAISKEKEAQAKDDEDQQDNGNSDSGEPDFAYESTLHEKIKNRLTEDLIREVYFASKEKLGLLEGVQNKRHYVSSRKIDPHQKRILEVIEQCSNEENMKKLQEKANQELSERVQEVEETKNQKTKKRKKK